MEERGICEGAGLSLDTLGDFSQDAKFGFWVADNIIEGRGEGGFYDVELKIIVLNLSALLRKDIKF